LKTRRKKYFRFCPLNKSRDIFDDGYCIRTRIYKITYGQAVIEVACPLLRKKGGHQHTLVIPEFLVPRRPYPIFVYLFAIKLYSANPSMGQRAAAEATRKQFGLKTFAHTTLGRALKSFTENLAQAEVVSDVDQPLSKESANDRTGNRFPSVQDTRDRRSQAAAFLSGQLDTNDNQQFIDNCHHIAARWLVEHQRLLL
jgi:hypothetical protein